MNVGLVGYGKMGMEIFKLLSEKGFPVTVFVRSEEKSKYNKNKIDRGLERYLRKGIITEEEFRQKKVSLLFTNHLEDLALSDVVIESIVEDRQEKLDIFHRLESIIGPKAIFLTNTSSLSITDLARELKYKDRFCGLHFFHPVSLIDLVEIIKWTGVPADLINLLADFCKSIGKKAIVVNDTPASAINAILTYYYLEGLYILEQGLALPSKLDELGKRFFFIGPCESLDAVGISLFTEALERTRHVDKEGMVIPELLYKMSSEGRLGKKYSKGIFLYQEGKIADDVPEFYLNPDQSHSHKYTDDSESFIAKRLLYSVFNGFLYGLERGVSSMEELDFGVKEVLNMKDGPFTMMRSIGIKKLSEEFNILAQRVGIRFRQTALEKLLYPALSKIK